MRRARSFVLLICLFASAVRLAAGTPEYLRTALAHFSGDTPRGWAYTLTTRRGEDITAERYDPAAGPGLQWTLLLRNGHSPSVDEAERYAKFKARPAPATVPPTFDKRDFDPGSFRLVREDANHAEFEVRFREDTGDKMLRHLSVRLVVAKERAAVESFHLNLLAPFSPILGVKIQKLEVQLANSPPTLARPALPLRSSSRFVGRLFLVKTIEETEEVGYSDYTFVGSHSAAPVSLPHAVKLSKASFKRAADWLCHEARPLERALFAHWFENAPRDTVLAELGKFQNPDGGFGHALEPDLRLDDSSVYHTTVALQLLRELDAPAAHPLVAGALRYLAGTYQPEARAWPIIPAAADRVPRAPWWNYDADLTKFLGNPRAEVTGYLLDYGTPPAGLLDAVMAHFDAQPEKMEMHDLLCYVRLAGSRALPAAARNQLQARLNRTIAAVLGRTPEEWKNYSLKPLTVAPVPASSFTESLGMEIAANLDYEIGQQGPDGAWAPNWSWFDGKYRAEWAVAEREWKGILTVRLLRTLQAYGRLE